MEQERPKRIAIIGLPGSGKSTFSIKLGKLLNLPVYHLDKYMFEGRKKRDKQEFLVVKEMLVKEEFWIIEGCSFSTLEMRFARANTVIYFNFPRWLCLWRISKRLFEKNNNDTGCLQGINWTLIKYIWYFNRDKKQGIEELIKKYPHVNFLAFRKPDDADCYLDALKVKS
jgi:adenylate kinase family enzyme